jgi:hypothetical protein
MNTLCSNCRKVVGIQEHNTDPNLGPVLCPECGDTFLSEYGGVSLGETLDKFEDPIVVFNKELRVVACNRKGLKEVEAVSARAYGLLSGEFMDCRNASLGGVCGQSPNCPQCGIRNSVTTTLSTGKPLKNVPAYFTSAGTHGTFTREWNLSTHKVGETVHASFHRPVQVGSQFRRV